MPHFLLITVFLQAIDIILPLLLPSSFHYMPSQSRNMDVGDVFFPIYALHIEPETTFFVSGHALHQSLSVAVIKPADRQI